jgi:hypothetical protein
MSATAGWIAAGLLVLLMVAGVVIYRREARQLKRVNEVAQALGGELRRESRTAFGQTTTYHKVTYQRGERTVTLDLTSGGTLATLAVPGGKADWLSLKFEGGVEVVTAQEQDRARADEFLDARVRANLERMERVGKDPYRAVSVNVAQDTVAISKNGRLSARETLLFLNLCWPVFDRALSVYFGKAVEPAARTCPTCGGDCCRASDGAHAPACGCASA